MGGGTVVPASGAPGSCGEARRDEEVGVELFVLDRGMSPIDEWSRSLLNHHELELGPRHAVSDQLGLEPVYERFRGCVGTPTLGRSTRQSEEIR